MNSLPAPTFEVESKRIQLALATVEFLNSRLSGDSESIFPPAKIKSGNTKTKKQKATAADAAVHVVHKANEPIFSK